MPIGPTELVIVMLIIFFVFGAGKLPEVGGALGKGIREFRAATRDEAPTEGSKPAQNEGSN